MSLKLQETQREEPRGMRRPTLAGLKEVSLWALAGDVSPSSPLSAIPETPQHGGARLSFCHSPAEQGLHLLPAGSQPTQPASMRGRGQVSEKQKCLWHWNGSEE